MVLIAPYSLYLAAVAVRWGNPWTPLAWRTTKAMGAWRLWNPEVPTELLNAAASSLFTLYTPGVWLLGLVAATSAVGASRNAATRALLIPALAFLGLTAADRIFHAYPVDSHAAEFRNSSESPSPPTPPERTHAPE